MKIKGQQKKRGRKQKQLKRQTTMKKKEEERGNFRLINILTSLDYFEDA